MYNLKTDTFFGCKIHIIAHVQIRGWWLGLSEFSHFMINLMNLPAESITFSTVAIPDPEGVSYFYVLVLFHSMSILVFHPYIFPRNPSVLCITASRAATVGPRTLIFGLVVGLGRHLL